MIRIMRALGLKGPPPFYIDFVLFPAIAFVIFAGWCRDLNFVLWSLAGALLFSFFEYWVHRIGLHIFYYHDQHEKHHKYPAGYVVFPVWYVPAIYAAFFLIFPLPVFAGLVVGLVWFITWHHFLHHFDLTKWPRFVQRYAFWHLVHHKDETVNFGITTNIWDAIFGTYRKT